MNQSDQSNNPPIPPSSSYSFGGSGFGAYLALVYLAAGFSAGFSATTGWDDANNSNSLILYLNKNIYLPWFQRKSSNILEGVSND